MLRYITFYSGAEGMITHKKFQLNPYLAHGHYTNFMCEIEIKKRVEIWNFQGSFQKVPWIQIGRVYLSLPRVFFVKKDGGRQPSRWRSAAILTIFEF